MAGSRSSPLGSVADLAEQVDDDDEAVLVADAQLRVAGLAVGVLGAGGDRDARADGVALDGLLERRAEVGVGEQLGGLGVVGAEGLLLGEAVAHPDVREGVVALGQLLAVALDEDLRLDLLGGDLPPRR